MIIVLIITNTMSNILKFKNKENLDFAQSIFIVHSIVSKLYEHLINSGYASCEAFHQAIKLLIITNPQIKLSEVPQKTFKIIYPIYDDYNESSIDIHSQN